LGLITAPQTCVLVELAARRGECVAQRDMQVFAGVISTRLAVGMYLAAGEADLDVYPKRAAFAVMTGRSFDGHMTAGDSSVKALEPPRLVSRHSFDRFRWSQSSKRNLKRELHVSESFNWRAKER